MASNPSEEMFESSICSSLLDVGGYVAVKNDLHQGDPRDFDPVRGLDTAELFTFIGATQGDTWAELVKRYGGDPDRAQARFADRLAAELDRRGTVDVLRHGVVDQAVTIRFAYFKPAHGLTPELVDRYEANRLTATRQLRYEPTSTKTLDLALFVNGIPVATAELKNPLTGQGVEHAIRQYRTYDWKRQRETRVPGSRTGSSIPPDPGSPTRSPGWRTGCPPCTQRTPRSLTRSW